MYATIVADAREREGANPYFEAAIAECNRTRLAPSERSACFPFRG